MAELEKLGLGDNDELSGDDIDIEIEDDDEGFGDLEDEEIIPEKVATQVKTEVKQSNSINDSDDIDIDFGEEDEDIGESDESIEGEDTELSLDEQIAREQAEINKLENSGVPTAESLESLLAESKSNEIDSDSDDGDEEALLDSNTLLNDDMEIASGNDFISDTGDIVLMDQSDKDDNFKLIYVDIENIAIVKRIRMSNNVEDLITSIKSTGLLKPVDVAPTRADGVYVLLDGYRRVLACARCGKRRMPCVVNLRVSVPEIPVLEAMYNHSKAYTVKEMVNYIEYLEKEKGIMSASMIEYLLQMNSGDYTKLKDILNDDDDDIVSKLMNGQMTIGEAFKKLEQRRKKESSEEKEIKKVAKVYEDEAESGAEHIAESGETGEDSSVLSEEEIKELAISAGDIDKVDDENLEELIQEGDKINGFQPHKQDPRYRERLDPALRKSVLARDENTCKICGVGGMEFIDTLDIHHIIEVYLGGSDNIDNLVTACTVCHKLIHLYARGELHMRPITELDEAEQKRFKRVIKLGTKIRQGMEMKGMKREELKKMDNAQTIGRTKPGTGQVAG